MKSYYLLITTREKQKEENTMKKIERKLLETLLAQMAINLPIQNVVEEGGELFCETAEVNLRILSGGKVTVEEKSGTRTAQYQIEAVSRQAVVIVKLYCGPIGRKATQWNNEDKTKVYQMAKDVAVCE